MRAFRGSDRLEQQNQVFLAETPEGNYEFGPATGLFDLHRSEEMEVDALLFTRPEVVSPLRESPG